MEFWFATINSEKINKIEEASRDSGINYKKGLIIKSTEISKNEKEPKVEEFYPLFCRNRIEAEKILAKYFEITNESSKSYIEDKNYFINKKIRTTI